MGLHMKGISVRVWGAPGMDKGEGSKGLGGSSDSDGVLTSGKDHKVQF